MKQETILVVDDNREIVFSISELLRYEGYRVVNAYDGLEALEVLEREEVDLILLDVMMPSLNGLSALMKLRERWKIPVIILSAKTEESDKVSGLTLGADDYIGKPYNAAEQIYECVWEQDADYAVENTVIVHIRHIREQIEIDAKNPRYIKVVWGIGYKMERYL